MVSMVPASEEPMRSNPCECLLACLRRELFTVPDERRDIRRSQDARCRDYGSGERSAASFVYACDDGITWVDGGSIAIDIL